MFQGNLSHLQYSKNRGGGLYSLLNAINHKLGYVAIKEKGA